MSEILKFIVFLTTFELGDNFFSKLKIFGVCFIILSVCLFILHVFAYIANLLKIKMENINSNIA